MQFSPTTLHVKEIEKAVLRFEAVENLHHVHVWRLNDQEIHLEAHVDFKENLPLSQITDHIEAIEAWLKSHFKITHITLQAEYAKKDDKALIYTQGCCNV